MGKTTCGPFLLMYGDESVPIYRTLWVIFSYRFWSKRSSPTWSQVWHPVEGQQLHVW